MGQFMKPQDTAKVLALKEKRTEKYYQIIASKNDADDSTGGLFDCGELGFLLLSNGRYGWEGAWYFAEKCYQSPAEGKTGVNNGGGGEFTVGSGVCTR